MSRSLVPAGEPAADTQSDPDADGLAGALAADDTVRIVAARTTHLVATACRRHDCSPTVAAALGRLLTGAALMGASLRAPERVTLQVSCDGPVRGLVADASAGGAIRGYPLAPRAERPLTPRGKFDVGGIVGRGFLHVTRTFATGLPYTSATPLVSGEIGEDLAYFCAQSDQIPSVVAVGVLANPSGILAAGGFIAQLLPGAREEHMHVLERTVRHMPHPSRLVRQGMGPEDIALAVGADLSPRITHRARLRFACTCSRSRVTRMLVGLGHDDLRELGERSQPTEVVCHVCRRRYTFTPAEIRTLHAAAERTADAQDTLTSG
jgi:molecular chaperone Hsp33